MIRTLSVILALAVASVVRAQPASVEIFGGFASWEPSLDSRYDASYIPSRVVGINQLFEDPDPRSRGQQSLSLQGKTSPGFGLGVNVYPHSVLGFQFLFDRARIDVAGENPPHEVSITYDTIAFPTPERVVRTTEFTFASPDTEGTFEETSLSFNLTARFGTGSAVGGSVSGGLSYLRFSAEGERIGALAAWLGGHAVLFSELYEASFLTSTGDALGFNVGGQIDVSLGAHLALFADGRLFRAAKTEVPLGLENLVSINVVTVPVGQIENFLDLPPVELDPSFLRLLFGLKWKL